MRGIIMKQFIISVLLLVFLSGCSVHMHRPHPHYVQKQNTVYVTKYKTKVVHKNVYRDRIVYKRYKYIPKTRKRVIIRYY